jgi:sugar O-acyltransferase (sialic acid O-acetyltransferase NeuD family)
MPAFSALILGSGGHAHVVASLIKPQSRIGYVVPQSTANDELTETEFFAAIGQYSSVPVYLGIGDNAIRAKLLDRLTSAGIAPATAIAPNAFVADDVEIGAGTVVCPGAVINTRAKIGRGVIINTLAGIDHDCVLGDICQIAPGVSLGGTVRMGRNCFLGIKTAVFPNTTLGNNVVVRGGSVVTRSYGDDVQIGGIPARVLKTL